MIIQIMPCPTELYARFKQGGEEFTTRIIGFALVEEDVGDGEKYRSVIGLEWCESEISLVTSNHNFTGYTERQIP